VLGANLTDDCNSIVNDASVYFNMTNTRTNESYRCPSSGYAAWNGTLYNCSISAAGLSSGWFDIRVYANKSSHWNDFKKYNQTFFLVKPVQLTNPVMQYTGDGSWGETHFFNVTADHYAPIQVCLIEKYALADPYHITECQTI